MNSSGSIDLGVTPQDSGLAQAKESAQKPQPSYPSFHARNVAALHDLPEGKFHFHAVGRVVSKTKTTRNGKDEYSHEVEVHSITPKSGKKDKDEGGLDKALNDIEKKKK